MHFNFLKITNKQLKEARLEKKLTQAQLAALVCCTRETIINWEKCSHLIDLRTGVPKRLDLHLNLSIKFQSYARARPWGFTDNQQIHLDKVFEDKHREAQRLQDLLASRQRVMCSARTRRGTPCKQKSEPGKKRCKFHGGKSTGPKTAAGKSKISEAQKTRWKLYRAMQNT